MIILKSVAFMAVVYVITIATLMGTMLAVEHAEKLYNKFVANAKD